MTIQHAMKYIRTKSGFTLWPEATMIFHVRMADLIKHEPVISAGFVIITAKCVHTYGQSDSLGIGVHPDDRRLLEELFDIRRS